MKTELKDVSPTQKELHIEIPADDVREVYNKVSQKYARAVTVPGFRKGFAPIDVVRVRYKEEIKSEVFRELLPDRVTAAIQDNDLSPIGEPQLHIEDVENVKVNGSQPISLHVHIEVMPQIESPKYEGLEAVRRIRPVKEEELDRIIDERRQQGAGLIPVEGRKSQEGDTLIVDLEGIFIDKPEEAPITAADLEITIGEQHIEKAFNENLIGLEQDDEREFTVEYPDDFSSQFLAGQKVKYKAKVKSVGTMELPAADDDWAQSLEESFESMKDLRKKLRDDLETMAKMEADNKVRDELVTKLIDAHDVEVPPTLIHIQARNLLENFAQDLARQGMDINKLEQDFIKMAYEQMRGQAERDVRGALLLEEVAKLENVEVSGDEIAEEIEKMATYYRVSAEEVRKSLSQQGGEDSVADRLRSRKAVEKLVEKAKVTDAEWIDESQAKAAPAEDQPAEVNQKKSKKKAAKEAEPAEPKAKKARKKSE